MSESAKQKKPRDKNEFYEVFQAWFTDLASVPYQMKDKDWVGIATIKKYCEENCSKNYSPLDSFKWVLFHHKKLPKFFQENRNPAFMASRFSEMISLLKTPARENSGQRNLIEMHEKAVSNKIKGDTARNNLNLLQ